MRGGMAGGGTCMRLGKCSYENCNKEAKLFYAHPAIRFCKEHARDRYQILDAEDPDNPKKRIKCFSDAELDAVEEDEYSNENLTTV